jgi:hypothetical protein
MAGRTRRAPRKLPRIIVNGPRPAQAVTVVYPANPEQLAQLTVGSSSPMRREQWESYRERTEWLAHVAALCAGLHPEQTFEYSSFLTNEEHPRVTIAVMTTPPVIVIECPFIVSDEVPQPPKRPIYGANGQQIN